MSVFDNKHLFSLKAKGWKCMIQMPENQFPLFFQCNFITFLIVAWVLMLQVSGMFSIFHCRVLHILLQGTILTEFFPCNFLTDYSYTVQRKCSVAQYLLLLLSMSSNSCQVVSIHCEFRCVNRNFMFFHFLYLRT